MCKIKDELITQEQQDREEEALINDIKFDALKEELN